VVPPPDKPVSRSVKPLSLMLPRRVEIVRLDRKLLAVSSAEKVPGAPQPLTSLPILMSEPTSPEEKVYALPTCAQGEANGSRARCENPHLQRPLSIFGKQAHLEREMCTQEGPRVKRRRKNVARERCRVAGRQPAAGRSCAHPCIAGGVDADEGRVAGLGCGTANAE
jgi:hypothetical protein